MYVRVGTMEVSRDRLDEAKAVFQERLLPAARSQKGYRGAAFLVERSTGKTLMLAWWDTEQEMHASREYASENRDDAARAIGSDPPTVEEYEVAVWDFRDDERLS